MPGQKRQVTRIILAGFAGLTAASCHTAKLPALLVPHNDYDSSESYWSAGRPILVSTADHSQVAMTLNRKGQYLTISVYVRNISNQRFDADEKNISVFLFHNQMHTITPEMTCPPELFPVL